MSAIAGRVLIIPKGNYNAATTYEMLDQVFYNGSSYICKQTSLSNPPTDPDYWQISAQGAQDAAAGAYFGSCESQGAEQTKVATVANADNFTLKRGCIIGVRFTYSNTFVASSANRISLNVNNSGLYSVYFGADDAPAGTNVVAFGEAGFTNYYMYDGTYWVYIGRSGVQTATQTPLEAPISVGGVSKANVEETLGALNTKETNEVAAIVNVYGSKNLNSYPYYETTKNANGITFTDLGDGKIKVGGDSAQTATATTSFSFHRRFGTTNVNPLVLKNGTYIVTGCPSGGSDSKYYLGVGITKNSSSVSVAKDYGNGTTFTINGDDSSADEAYIGLAFSVLSGTTIPAGGIIVEPMIRDARVSDATFVPYAKTNRELTLNVNKTLKYLGQKTFTAQGDAVKTSAQLLADLMTQFNTYKSGKGDEYRYSFISLLASTSSGSTTLNFIRKSLEDKSFNYNGIKAYNFRYNNGNVVYYEATLTTTCTYYNGDIGSITDHSSDVVPSNRSCQLTIGEYELI